MDVAYDHIQEEVNSPQTETSEESKQQERNLNTEISEAYKAFSASPWGTKLGDFLSTVKQQGEKYYEGARKEYDSASTEATKGFSDLRDSIVSRTRSLSLELAAPHDPNAPLPDNPLPIDEQEAVAESSRDATAAEKQERFEPPESLPADIVKEATSMVSRFRSEASKRLKDIEKAEDAADEALLRFGSNVRNFLREAVSIAPPSEEEAAARAHGGAGSSVLFESKDAEGKRVIHTSRYEAQLHVIHSSADSFLRDPKSDEYEKWKAGFDVKAKTEEISRDLEKYEELRRVMEKLVPEKVEYEAFWTRYYFLRHVIETEEARRREMLKGAAAGPEEEVGWDEDSDDENVSTPQGDKGKLTSSSSTTLHAPAGEAKAADTSESRRSNDEQSRADSDASYDIVSGAASATPGSPKEKKKEPSKNDESDEEDWE